MEKRICSVPGCERPAKTRAMCQSHYTSWWRSGETPTKAIRPMRAMRVAPRGSTAKERFDVKVDKAQPGGCWLWLGATMPNGYGRFKGDDMRTLLAHRWSYEHHVGPIPAGLHIDHLCRNRACVNPAHLEPVTHAENLRRGQHPGREKTHCLRGHPYDEQNTIWDQKGQRSCRACRHVHQATYRARRKAAALSPPTTTIGAPAI